MRAAELFSATGYYTAGFFSGPNLHPTFGFDQGFDESMQPAPHLVAFTTGWGDGQYACFWGLDQAEKPVALVMDVELVAGLEI
mgnify:CR=1 FL=1